MSQKLDVAVTQEESSDSWEKRLCRRGLPWRFQELQKVVESLDRKLERRCSDRAKAMCLKITMGSDSQREIPNIVPEWAIELFPS